MKKVFVYPFLVVLLSFILGACSEQAEEKSLPEKEEVAHIVDDEELNDSPVVHWSYDEDVGPENWGELDSSFLACMNGNEQSPINIESVQVKTNEELENIEIQYQPTHFSIMNNGHTIQANPEISNNSIVVEGEEYILAQFHFHTPSEHQFDGQNMDMELHLVHQDTNGNLAVLGVMIQEGKENETLASIWEEMPKGETVKDVDIKNPVDLETLLPSNQASFHYNGSLTTPPCAEEVNWIVFEQPIEMSKEQIQAYREIFPDNHRPVQPLNEREIFGIN